MNYTQVVVKVRLSLSRTSDSFAMIRKIFVDVFKYIPRARRRRGERLLPLLVDVRRRPSPVTCDLCEYLTVVRTSLKFRCGDTIGSIR